jgi:hypothetical protein
MYVLGEWRMKCSGFQKSLGCRITAKPHGIRVVMDDVHIDFSEQVVLCQEDPVGSKFLPTTNPGFCACTGPSSISINTS